MYLLHFCETTRVHQVAKRTARGQQCKNGLLPARRSPVIGCVDGMHIRIQAPNKNEDNYEKPKGFLSSMSKEYVTMKASDASFKIIAYIAKLTTVALAPKNDFS